MPLKNNGIFVDGTLGGGGHSEALLRKCQISNFKCQIIGIDQDLEAIIAAKKNLKKIADKIIFVHDNYSNLAEILASKKIDKIDGILLDLGVSSYQLDNPERGFSFQSDASLDMRMNQNAEETAGEIVNYYDEKKLADIFYKFGEEKYSRQIAKKIIEERKKTAIKTTAKLVEIIKAATPPKYRFGSRIHFATRVFQALRIEVNNELQVLEQFIPAAVESLNKNGRLIIISFHSLEDRIVKHTFRNLENAHPEEFKVLTKKPLIATDDDVRENPRSRSAKMRVIEKI